MSRASNSNGNGAGGNGESPAASYTFIDTLGEGLAEAVMAMNAASLVAVDCEGVELSRAGELCLLQLGTGEFWQPPPSALDERGNRERRETASKTDVTIHSWATERFFFSSLVFDTVATALYQLGTPSASFRRVSEIPSVTGRHRTTACSLWCGSTGKSQPCS